MVATTSGFGRRYPVSDLEIAGGGVRRRGRRSTEGAKRRRSFGEWVRWNHPDNYFKFYITKDDILK